MEGPVNIMDEIAKAAALTNTRLSGTLGKAIHYAWGHPLEIVETLQQMTKDPNQQALKYPLVGLFTDIAVQRNLDGFYGQAKFTIIVATLTKPEYKAAQRKAINFGPILQPIKTELIRQITRLPQFIYPGDLYFTEIEHYYWGKEGLYGNKGNIFNDWIDCIELRDIQVNINNKICNTLKANI